ncbi:hypothetical protein ACE1TH_07205 [Shouchella sp. JSM 1781072]|nr:MULTISPECIES: hypothetical protein [Bacillaceae]
MSEKENKSTGEEEVKDLFDKSLEQGTAEEDKEKKAEKKDKKEDK